MRRGHHDEPDPKAALLIGSSRPDAAQLILTCEHGSNVLPPNYRWEPRDRWLAQTHWAWDIGATTLTRTLCRGLEAPAVIARYSRLLVDLNRELDSPTLFRDDADGRPVFLNVGLSAEVRAQRVAQYYAPYHRSVDEVCGAQRAASIVLSVHTYTPVYQGQRRTLEVGVLFDKEAALGEQLTDHLLADGFDAAPNEPYSGLKGLAYAVQAAADRNGRRALEIEVRQDLAVCPRFAARLLPSLARFFSAIAS